MLGSEVGKVDSELKCNGLDYQIQGFDHLTPGPSHYNIQDKSEDLDSSPSTAIYQLCN